MALGDVQTAISSVANNAFLDIKPASGVEWVIHNVLYNGAMELYKTDGTNSIKVDSDTTAGGRIGVYLHAPIRFGIRLKTYQGRRLSYRMMGCRRNDNSCNWN
jgi:hypothetical protein